MNRLQGLVLLSILPVSLLLGVRSASSQEDATLPRGVRDDAVIQTANEVIAAEAKWYAEDQGVTRKEAMRRLRIQRQMGDLIEQLRRVHGVRLAGIIVDHQPTYRVRVRLTGDKAVRSQTVKIGGSELSIFYETGARSTLRGLRSSLGRNQGAIAELYPTLAGIGIDEGTSEIVLTVYAVNETDVAHEKSKLADAKAILGHDVRIETTDAYPVLHDVRGGSRIVPPSNLYCTSGFVVKNTAGTTAVATAAHCDNPQTYYNPNGTSIPLTFVSEVLDADQDVQIHTSAYVERPEFYWDDNKTAARTLTGRRLRSSTAFNDNVCHRGENTGYSCGYVQQTDYAPYNPTQPLCGSQACAAVFIRVTGASLECAGGDSGGPWFASTVAFGIHKGGASSGSGPGQCSYAFYMSTDSLPTGWSLLYGP